MKKITTADYYLFEKSSLVLRALNNELRQKIIATLETGEMSVTSLYTKLKLEQSVASQHLAILRREGIVSTNRNGKEILYKLDYERIAEIKDAAEKMVRKNVVAVDQETE